MIFHNFLSIILGDSARLKALKVLLKQPLGVTGRALGKLIGVSHSKVNIILRELVAQGVVKMHVQGKAHVYQINNEHFLIENIRPILELESNIFTILGQRIFSLLDQKPLSIILHGSIARGDERPDSDIDTLFIFDDDIFKEGLADDILERCSGITTEFGNFFSVIAVPLSKFVSGVKEKDPFFRNVVKEGKTIAGLTINEVMDHGRAKYQNG